MLSTSPVLSSSANTSPTGFRHGSVPTRALDDSPLHSSSGSRRPSLRSVSSPTASTSPRGAPRSRNYLQRDSSQETSPKVQGGTPSEPPPPPRPQPMTAPKPSVHDSSQSSSQTALQQDHGAADGAGTSPVKRRSSSSGQRSGQDNAESQEGPAEDSEEQTAKRARAEEKPPKILPQRYELCAAEDMVELIAHMLAELIATNDSIRIPNGGLTRFHSRTAPGISVRDYLHRLAKHATLTPPLLLAMVYYIDRLCAMYQDFNINKLTVHRFLITAATVASKGLSDSFWNNTTYARVGGVRLAELKLLEVEFLYRVDWKIVPDPEVLVSYYNGLVERTPGYELESDGSTSDGEEGEGDAEEGAEEGAEEAST